MQRYLAIKSRLLERGAYCPYSLYICYGMAETGYPFRFVADQLAVYLGVGRDIVSVVLRESARGADPQPICESIVQEVLEDEG